MKLSGRQALVDACPELYEGLDVDVVPKNHISQYGEFVLKEVNPTTSDGFNELNICRILMDVSRQTEVIPVIYDVQGPGILMEDVRGSTLRVNYDPDGHDISGSDEDLASYLLAATKKFTSVLGGETALIHGDLGPNNIRKTDSGLVFVDFEKSSVEPIENRFTNIAQLITRLWFNKPLMLRVTELQSILSDDIDLFGSQLDEAIDNKLHIGVAHYPVGGIIAKRSHLFETMSRNLAEAAFRVV